MKLGTIGSHILILVSSLITVNQSLAMAIDDMAAGGLSLSLSASLTPSTTKQEKDVDNQDTSAIMMRIMNDECNEEFSLTQQAIEYVDNILQQFALSLNWDPNKVAEGNFISSWLTTKVNGQQLVQPDELVVRMATELDYIYGSFWSEFKRSFQQLIVERPPDLNNLNLAFRCERYNELIKLNEMAQKSSLYRIILDIFSSEFYTHCLTRKLAMIKLHHIKPSSILQQFVDIYLDMPTHYALGDTSTVATKMSEEQTIAGLALQFNLQQSLARHGPLESAANLVFDANSALSMGLGRPNAKDLVQRFRSDCDEHGRYLMEIWGNFDELVAYLSSPMNDLAAFNARIKNAAPQLVYGALCGQLVQAAVSQ